MTTHTLEIALPVPLPQTFSYLSSVEVPVGSRVRVPFGKRTMVGLCLGVASSPVPEGVVLKEIEDVLDAAEPVFGSELLALSRWLADYYLCAIGLVQKTMFPVTLRQRSMEVPVLAADLPPVPVPILPPLSSDQENALFKIIEESQSGTRRPFLLHGITGSGKTRVYMHLIERLPMGAQALVLVPEIALTPQITAVFEEFFPGQVAMVHSGLTDKQRWGQWERVFTGKARVLIGARSAVFVPFRNLQLIIVDEEHDTSYKQAHGFCYHARDVAIVRGHKNGAAVVLGSATPSLETYKNALDGRYAYTQLTQRPAQGAALPHVVIVEPPAVMQRKVLRGDEVSASSPLFAPEVLAAIARHHAAGGQAIVVVNRRGYAYYLIDAQEGTPVSCERCSITYTVHLKKNRLLCHYCGAEKNLQQFLQAKPQSQFLVFGSGAEKAEMFLQQALPQLRIARIDSETAQRKHDFFATLEQFRRGELDVIVGTQIMAKGHDFPNVSLVVIAEIDSMFNLPDFRAGERTFQMLVQAAGRTGRGSQAGHVLLQAKATSQSMIHAAMQHHYEAFAHEELKMRKDFLFPPFAHSVRIEFLSRDLKELESFCQHLTRWMEEFFSREGSWLRILKVQGPSTPPIERIDRWWRRCVMLTSPDKRSAHAFARKCLEVIGRQNNHKVKVQVDVDPVNLL
jgi:primosomal protein N' (replication factor Y)